MKAEGNPPHDRLIKVDRWSPRDAIVTGRDTPIPLDFDRRDHGVQTIRSADDFEALRIIERSLAEHLLRGSARNQRARLDGLCGRATLDILRRSVNCRYRVHPTGS